MSNAIASLSVKVVADTHGFDLSSVRKDMSLLRKLVADTEPEVNVFQRRMTVLGEMFKDRSSAEYTRALAALYEQLSDVALAELAATDATAKHHHEMRQAAARAKIYDAELVQPRAIDQQSIGMFGRQQLASRLPIVGELEAAAAAAGPAGVLLAGAFAGAAVEAYALGKGISWLTRTTLDGIEKLNALADSAQMLGISAGSLDRLQIAADIGGSRVESLTSALEKMETLLGDPSDELRKTLAGIGLDAEKLKALRADQSFEAIAAAIGRVGGRSEQLAIITEVFGKGNRDLINYIDNLDEANAAAERLRMSNENVFANTKGDDALRDVRLEYERITKTIATELSPVVVEVGGLLKDILASDVTQSGLYTGLAAIRSTLDGVGESAKTVKDILAATQTGSRISMIAGVSNPFSELGDAMQEATRLDKLREQMAREREKADAALVQRDKITGAADILKDASGGFAKQLRDAIEYERELAKLTEQIEDYGNAEAQARRKAVEAGAKSQEQIDRYVASVMALDKLKKGEQQRQQDEREAERERIEKERKQTAIADSFLTDRQRAIRELRDARAAGVGGDLMDQLVNRTARGLLPQVRDTGPRTVEKGSQEAFRAMARQNRVDEQVRLLREIRDGLRRDALGERIVVEEVQI